MPTRPPDEGPTTAARATRMDGVDAAQKIDEAQARANAMRDQATAQGRSAGAVRPGQQDPKAHLEAQASARAASAAAAAAFVNQFADLTEGAMGDGAFDAEEAVDEETEQEKEEPIKVRRATPGRARGPELGGEADPEAGAGSADDAPEDPTRRGPARWPRVSAKRRVRDLELARLLQVGAALGILVGWQGDTVERRVLGLTAQWYHRLAELMEAVGHDPGRIVLLKALAAHRHPEDIAQLLAPLETAGAEGVLAWHAALEEERPAEDREAEGPTPEIDVLRRHYDPLATLVAEAPGPGAPAVLEEWTIPMWLRGAPREPLELCAVAFHQAACDHLHPEWETSAGSGDALMAALETHYAAHPAVARWNTTLGARAQDGPGLWAAIDALRRARSTL